MIYDPVQAACLMSMLQCYALNYTLCLIVVRDIASGSKRITEVNEAFHSSAETLEQQSKTYGVITTVL